MQKKELYKLVTIGGAGMFLPIVLLIGPVGGVILGNYLVDNLHSPLYVRAICVLTGFLGSGFEAVRIIRFILKESRKN